MRKVIHESKYFRLTSENKRDPNKRGKGPRYFRIVWHNWWIPEEDEETIRDLVDPDRNISGRNGCSWLFKSEEEARKRYTMLLLRWE